MDKASSKKILVINWRDRQNPEAGGAEIYYHEIFKRLAARGYDVSILSHAYSGCAAREDYEGLHIIRAGSKHLFNYAVIPILLKHQKEYDLIIEDLNKIPFFTPLYVKRPRMHLVMHFFGGAIFSEIAAPMASYIYLMEKLVPVIYKKERFVAISQSTKKEIEAFSINPQHLHVVEPGIDTSFYHPTQAKSSKPLLVCISRLKKYKNVQFLIPALAEIRRQIPECELIIAGSGDYLPELKAMAEAHGLSQAISFPGFISEEEKRNLLSKAFVFCNSSIKEGWGITNIEANLCGTVSLCSDVHGLRDSVKDGKTGLLFEFGNQDDFVTKAIKLLINSALRNSMEKNAIAFAKGFDWDTITARMEKIIASYL